MQILLIKNQHSFFLFEIKVDKGYPIFITNLVCQKIVEKFFNVLYNV